MTRIIGKGVQDHKIVLTAVEDKIRLIVILRGLPAQNAVAFWGPL
jgi:hypothetical protein